MRKFWTAFVKGTEGQDLIEYALLAALVALGATVGMQLLATGINTEFSSISASLTAAS
jgi:Flp pilus assembly pilin Flp